MHCPAKASRRSTRRSRRSASPTITRREHCARRAGRRSLRLRSDRFHLAGQVFRQSPGKTAMPVSTDRIDCTEKATGGQYGEKSETDERGCFEPARLEIRVGGSDNLIEPENFLMKPSTDAAHRTPANRRAKAWPAEQRQVGFSCGRRPEAAASGRRRLLSLREICVRVFRLIIAICPGESLCGHGAPVAIERRFRDGEHRNDQRRVGGNFERLIEQDAVAIIVRF